MTVKEIDDMDDWKALFEEAALSDKRVVIQFSAEWCVPCKRVSPVIDQLSEEFEESWLFAKVDNDKSSDISELEDIRVMPTFVFYKSSGEKYNKIQGAKDTAIRSELSLPMDY